MDDKNTACEVVSASINGSNLLEKPVESMNNSKMEESPTENKNDEHNGVEEIVEGKTCNYQILEDSKDKEDDKKGQLVEESLDNEAVTQAVVGQVQVNKDTVEHDNEPKEGAREEIVEQEDESKETVEQDNESKEEVIQEVATQDDEHKYTLGEDTESKELAASENLVIAVAEDETQKKEMSGEKTGDTKEIGCDGLMEKLARDVNEEESREEIEVKEGNENVDAGDKEKKKVEQEQKNDTSETEPVEVERNLEEKDVSVKNGLDTEQVIGKLEGSSNEEDKGDEGKGSKKRKRGKHTVVKTNSENKDEQGQRTPIISVSLRPVRERKSVERLVASIEKDVIREIFVEKGSGVALKDIPNVAYKLSKKKNEETLKQLHTILFGRRGKAIQIKSHVSQFSGFVWHDNEEKCKMKVREKFDKLVKEKLIEFCDVLDIPITNKVTIKKEDVVTKLMEFLASPHPTTDVLLSENEQAEKATKRKRSAGQGSTTLGSTKGSRKKRRKTSEKPKEGDEGESGSDGDSEKEKEDDVTGNQENGNGKQNRSEDESSEKKPCESEDRMDEDTIHRRQRLKKTSAKVESSAKKRTKPKTLKKPDLNDSEEPKQEDAKTYKQSPKKTSEKRGSTRKNAKKSDNPSKVGITSKLTPDTVKTQSSKVKEKIIVPSEPSIKKKIVKADPKAKPKEEKLKLSDEVLRDQICQILKEVDFNTATFTDIMKLLGEHFKTDLTPRKASIKLMIQEELTKMADAADDDDEEDDEKVDVTPEPAKINA